MGDLLGETGLRVTPGSRIVLGAAECIGFRMIFGPGEYGTGSYDQGSRGDRSHSPARTPNSIVAIEGTKFSVA